MPSAFYAVSYEDTGAILSYCQLQKQDLSKSGAVGALLDQIVGDNLSLSLTLSTTGVTPPPLITIAKSQLTVDEVNVPDKLLSNFITQPYQFELDLSDPLAKPGNGTLKQLFDPVPNALNPPLAATPLLVSSTPPTVTPAATANTLRVSFTSQVPPQTKFHVIVDGQILQPITVTGTTPPGPTPPIEFPIGVTVAVSSFHTVIVAARGFQTVFDVLQAKT